MRLGIKIILPILLLLVVILGAFGYLFYNLKQLETAVSAQTIKIQKLNSLNERLGRQQEQTDYSLLAYRFHPDKSFLLAISQAALDKSKTLDDMFPFITTSRGRELINSYIDTRKEVESLRNDLVKAIDTEDKKSIDIAYIRWSTQTQNIKAALADIGAYNINSLEKTLASVETVRGKITQTITVVVFIVVATVILFYAYLRLAITIPLVKLAQLADEIANKNFTTTTTTTTTGINSNDEIGMLARNFNTMSIKLKEYYGELEQKVKEKTEELSQKIIDLERAKIAARNVLEDLEIEQGRTTEAKVKDEAILSSIGDGMIATDTHARVIFMNEAMEKLIGWKKENVIGKIWFDIVPMEDTKGNSISDSIRPIHLAISDRRKTTTTATYYFIRKDKMKFPVAVTVTPIILNGKVTGAIGIYRDLTDEKAINKSKDEFLAIASHELRTPLVVIHGNASLMLHDVAGKLPVKAKKMVQYVYTSSDRLIGLVNNFLDVSRMSLGKLVMNSQKVAMDTFCMKVLDEFRIIARRKKIKLIHHPINGAWVKADPERLEQVLTNLISNSIKYTKAGTIMVSHTKEGKMLRTIVSDTGMGIDVNKQNLLFVKFQSATGEMLTRASGSTGLGLFISKALIEMMGGTLYLVKSTPKAGSTFAFTLPLWQRTS